MRGTARLHGIHLGRPEHPCRCRFCLQTGHCALPVQNCRGWTPARARRPAIKWYHGLKDLNPGLGYKDRLITFRHLATQTSCYGVAEAPGTAFDYNDWQMALFWDTLFLKVYGVTAGNADDQVLHALLTRPLECEDNPTFRAFGKDDRAGRLAISVRDFARFGLLYLRNGEWGGRQLISPAHACMAVKIPLPNSIPRTKAEKAEMCPGQRTLGSRVIPDDQTDHLGSYSYLWWINGVDREGKALTTCWQPPARCTLPMQTPAASRACWSLPEPIG
jgi:hypothetical protein